MIKLYGADLLIGEASRNAVVEALRSVEPRVLHVFFEHEGFDEYVEALARHNLAAVRSLPSSGGLSWKIDLELLQPFSANEIACALSRFGLIAAASEDPKASYSPYLVYEDGKFSYKAELINEDVAPQLVRVEQ